MAVYSRKKLGQVSVEYLLIVGFATLITIPLLITYIIFTQDSDAEITSAQLQQVGKKIVDAAEAMYYLGEPSQTTLVVNIPDNIVLVNTSGNELVYRIQTKDGQSDLVQNSAVNISGSLPTQAGTYRVTVVARTNYVEVSYS